MWLLALEALAALGMLVLIVWLTMGNTRKRDAAKERPPEPPSDDRK